MIRRTVLTALALTALGTFSAPAFADVISSADNDENHYICVLGTNHTTGVRDGICVWFPAI